jgi:hypothetical protein
MSEECLEQVEQKLDSLISAIQSGFGSFERQLNDLRSDNRQLSTDIATAKAVRTQRLKSPLRMRSPPTRTNQKTS